MLSVGMKEMVKSKGADEGEQDNDDDGKGCTASSSPSFSFFSSFVLVVLDVMKLFSNLWNQLH